MPIDLEYINPKTASIYSCLSQRNELKDFTLLGGTALALQAGHRNSLDLDFTLLTGDGHLPVFKIKSMMRSLGNEGLNVKYMEDPAQASQFRINTGLNLESLIMDYVVDGVKVQFFIKQEWSDQLRLDLLACSENAPHSSFMILNLNGLKIAKTMVLADRVRSRDLYDILWFLEESQLTIQEMESYVTLYDPTAFFDTYIDKLTGDTPIDEDDEGLDPVSVEITHDQLHEYLSSYIDEFEIERAKNLVQNLQSD